MAGAWEGDPLFTREAGSPPQWLVRGRGTHFSMGETEGGGGGGVLHINGQFHASVAETLAADEVVLAGHVQWDGISAGACGPVVELVL